MLQVTCPQCAATVPAENINLDNMMAKCAHCDAVFSIAHLQNESAESGKRSDKSTPLPMGMPDNISVDDDGMRLRIERRWFHWSGFIFLVFALFWNGILWGVFMPNFGRFRFGTADTFGQLFMLPFILVGLGMAVHGLSLLINRTILTVDDGELLVQHRPLPYPGKRLASGDIQQLFSKQHVSQHYSQNSGYSTSISYELRAMLNDGSEKKLLGGLNTSEQAQFIEQEVERFLRIKDRPVRGEYK